MITRQQLQIRNRRTLKYPLDIAEKDYFLTEAIKLISESPLGEQLVFKGGTALHHCYLPQHRFSEDLDFTSQDHNLTLEQVVNTLEATEQFVVRKRYESPATIKIERLWYTGILAQPGAIKVEVDRIQNVVLPPVVRPYQNVWGIEVMVQTMDLREIAAEKIRATATRVRYRDFYDLYLILENPDIDVESLVSLVRNKEVRATIGPEQIQRNWREAQEQADDDLRSIHCSRQIRHDDIAVTMERLQFAPVLPR
ncbi:MAG: nucleotidyl transferase AbiEii/AbiGii toxin family protein [Caldilineaceae bacterium]|nr:nucleotidyl transferase AbiEii/AbiGii toxin family protein [Caldilineaceae bacterium]